MDIQRQIKECSDKEIWEIFCQSKKELRERGLVRTANITGERGEFIAISIYNNTPGLPNLQAAPKSTQNVDALSRNGERYSIKTITKPGRATGVFFGMGDKDEDFSKLERKFEFLIIVMIDNEMEPIKIIELKWNSFLKHLKWQSRMRAYYIYVTEALLKDSKIIFDKELLSV